jgi:pimeloyl-ACP methyl ester carboxylesterase
LVDSLLFVPGTMCDQRLWQPMLHTAAGQQLQQLMAIQHAAIWQQSDLSGMLATIAAPQAAHLVGFSMGGYLALSHMLVQSKTELQHVKSLVLIAASAAPLPAAEFQRRQQILQWLNKHRYQGMSRKRLAEFVHSSQLQNPLVTEPLLAMDQELGHEVLQMQLSQTSLRPSLMDQLAQIHCPVLIIAGQDDRLVALAQLQQMAALIPDARLVVLPDSGHMLPLEQPAVIASELLAFYQRVVTKT